MADMEVLAPGGHQHLVGKIKEQLAMKADASLASAVEKVIENQPTAVLSGTVLTAADAYAEPPMALTVDGKSEQLTTTGRNLLDPNTLSNGYIASGGDVYGTGGTYKHNDYMPVVPGTAYRVSEGGGEFNAIWTCFYDEDKNRIAVITQRYQTSVVATAPDNAAYMRSSFNFAYEQYAMIEVDSGSWDGFEPYTGGKPSPSPDYPQEIVSVDELALNFTQNAAMMLEQGGFNTDGTNNTNQPTTRVRSVGFMPVSAGETLTIESATSNVYASVSWYTSDDINSARTGYVGFDTLPLTATVPSGATFARMLFKKGSAGTANISVDELADLTVTSSLHGTYSVLTVPLYDGTLRSLPDGTHDTLSLSYLRPSTREGWAWYGRELVQRVGTQTYDGSESWRTNDAWYGFSIDVPDSATATQANEILNTRGVGAAYSKAGMQSALGATGIGSGKLSYNWENATGTGRGPEFKAWLAENNMTVQYPLATPTTTQLDPIELPVLPAPECTVWSDPSTGLQMEYVRDMQIVIDSLNSEIERAYAAIAPVESTTAKSNHAVGDYLMLGGTLCKVTSAIASGETIAIGTNVAATTVDTELASLE